MTAVPYWQQICEQIDKDIVIPGNYDNFLQHPLIRETMYTGASDNIYQMLEDMFAYNDLWWPDRVVEILSDEPTFGNPDLLKWSFDGTILECSANSIQTLYHLFEWQETTGDAIEELGRVVEFGGGYGTMARLLTKINPKIQIVLIDLPVFRDLQFAYLDKISSLNTICLSLEDFILLDGIEKFDHVDLLVSTFALSESPRETIDLFAGIPSIAESHGVLLAHQQNEEKFDAAGDLVDILNQYRPEKITTRIPIMGSETNFYAFS